MPDPFSEPEFQDRLRKLLRMLASDQEQEADTARRKLLQHLAQHDLSANDLADRLGGAPSEELAAARTAARHAEQRAARADERRVQAEFALAAGRPPGSRSSRATRVGLGVLLVAVPCAGLALFLLLNGPAEAPVRRFAAPTPAAQAPRAAPSPAAPAEGTAMFSTGGMVSEVRQPPEWAGAILGGGTELRSDMRPDALVLAVLQEGERVTVQRAVTYQGSEWLQVNTTSGPGFVPIARVRRL